MSQIILHFALVETIALRPVNVKRFDNQLNSNRLTFNQIYVTI